MIIHIILISCTAGLLITAAFFDFFKLKIPNFIPLAVCGLFAIACVADYTGYITLFNTISDHLMAGGIIFAIMLVMFFTNMIGGGDAKLLPAVALWVGTAGLPLFILVTIFAGFPLALLSIFFKNTSSGQKLASQISKYPLFSQGWIKALANGENVVPYGIAIAFGGIFSFYTLGYFAINM